MSGICPTCSREPAAFFVGAGQPEPLFLAGHANAAGDVMLMIGNEAVVFAPYAAERIGRTLCSAAAIARARAGGETA